MSLAAFAALGVSFLAACASPSERAATDPGSDGAPTGSGIIDGPIGEWVWYEIPGAICANGTPTGIGVNQGSGSRIVIYLSGGGTCTNESCTVGTPSMRQDGGFGAAQLQSCVAGSCDGSVTFPADSIFSRSAATNPFGDATYVFISNCAGDYYVGNNEHAFPGWTAHFQGSHNQTLFAAEVAASFPDASRVVLSGGSAGSVGAMLNYWQWVNAFAGTRVDLVSDSFALVFADGPEWRYALHNPQVPPGCTTCASDYRTVYDFNSSIAPSSRIAVLDSENNWTLDLTSGYQYTQGLQALQQRLNPIANLKYFVANGSTHILLQYPLDDAAIDVQTLTSGTHLLSEFLGKMQADDPAWQSLTPL